MSRSVGVTLSIPGRQSAENALAAAAVGLALGVPASAIVGALKRFRAPEKRMEVLHAGDVTILNDTYNANPDSMIAALETLVALPARGKRIAVLGEMRELGVSGAEGHRRVGEAVRRLKVKVLLTYGAHGAETQSAAGALVGAHYEKKNILAESLAELVAPGDAVLVKGSRALRMEDVVTFLLQRLQPGSPAAVRQEKAC